MEIRPAAGVSVIVCDVAYVVLAGALPNRLWRVSRPGKARDLSKAAMGHLSVDRSCSSSTRPAPRP